MKTTRLIIVGGFLGAGKTTLLWEASQKIKENGLRVGLVTNDQAPELVDTAILKHQDIKVTEVSGSCFCCNFVGLINAMEEVKIEADADVIIAEPVGSCTDLSATLVQPLKQMIYHELLVSPLSVMADPLHLTDILSEEESGIHPSAAYIFIKQLEEADIILISKIDLLQKEEIIILKEKVNKRFPDAEIMTISSLTGEGMDEWLKEVMNRTNAGERLVDVDYDIYAEGEAVLGWLNSTIDLSGELTDWDAFAGSLMQDFSRQFDALNAYVGHVKMMLESGENYLIGNLTGKGDTLNFRGSAAKGTKARLTLNARVEMSPDTLEKIVRNTIEAHASGKLKAEFNKLRCLSPGRPEPTYRFDHIIQRLD
jgi:G3E family GTPase